MSNSSIKDYSGRMREINLFPKIRAPYFIWAPPWAHISSGVRALHLLCHALNEAGEKAYLVPLNQVYYVNNLLNTPLLNESINMFYHYSGVCPIIIYPDIVSGNPLQAKKVVRWLLAPAGAYGGDKEFAATDKVYGYTKDIAEPVLCLPTFDTNIFYPPPEGYIRKGSCFYSHKYDKIHGNNLLPFTAGMVRCEGSEEYIADILRKCEKCYVYERSEIMVNAALCGCEVIPIVTPYFPGKMPEEFFDSAGKLTSKDIMYERFLRQLEKFIEDTQHGFV